MARSAAIRFTSASWDTPSLASESGLLFTSGTTGVAKGAMITNEAFLHYGHRYRHAGGLMDIRDGVERLYNPLPLYYANAFAITNVVMIFSAGCMIFPDRFHPSAWWRDIVETGATIVHYLGIIPPLLLQRKPVPEERAHRLKFGVGGGIASAQHAEWERRFGFPLIEVYGMSELGICSASNREPRQIGSHSVGKPFPGIEFRIVDDDDVDVPVGTAGQILVRHTGSNPRKGFFGGYLDGQDVTEHAWRGGWFHTGDVLRQDRDGNYYFVDRIKHMIRRSGQNIPAAEVENGLRGHPGVAEVACVAVPDALRQEEVMACIVLRDDIERSAKIAHGIMDWALQRLAYFKTPGWILFVDTIPTTFTKKLQKDRIFAKDENPLERPGCFDLRHRKKPKKTEAAG